MHVFHAVHDFLPCLCLARPCFPYFFLFFGSSFFVFVHDACLSFRIYIICFLFLSAILYFCFFRFFFSVRLPSPFVLSILAFFFLAFFCPFVSFIVFFAVFAFFFVCFCFFLCIMRVFDSVHDSLLKFIFFVLLFRPIFAICTCMSFST